MKYLLPTLAAALLLFAYGVQNAHALTTYQVFQGGTGRSTFTSGQLLYGNGTTPISSVGTTTVSCGGGTSCSSFTAIGPSPITISSTLSLSPFATTTSTVPGNNIVYPLNDSDLVTIGSNSTTTSEFFFNPNTSTAYVSGKLGINQTLPGTFLTIAGTSTATTAPTMVLASPVTGIVAGSALGSLYFNSRDSQILDTNGLPAASIVAIANRTHTGAVDDSDLVFFTVGGVSTTMVEKMRLAANGVGIGTSTPFGSFAVQAFNTANRLMSFTNSSGVEIASMTSTGELGLVGTTTSATSNFGLAVNTGTAAGNNADNIARFVHLASGQTGAGVVISGVRTANSAYNFLEMGPDYDGTYVPTFVFRGDGRLGIGTTTPSSLLNISGSDAGTTITNASVAMVDITNTNATNNSFSDLTFSTNDTNAALPVVTSKIVGVHTDHTAGATSGALAFLTRNGGTIAERMRIVAGGNVGIGTTTPGHLLDLFATGTSTLRVDSNSTTQGSCLVLKDSDGAGYTYVTSANGVLTASTVACN